MASPQPSLTAPRVTLCGCSAFLFEAEGPMTLATQEQIWKLTQRILDIPWAIDAQPGMNNLLVLGDSNAPETGRVEALLLQMWAEIEPGYPVGKTIEMGIVYGGQFGVDLAEFAAFLEITPHALAELHAAPEYVVFAPGTAPGSGYGYLFGLDHRLFRPRRTVPTMRAFNATIMVGGSQCNISKHGLADGSSLGPSGWYAIGNAPEAPVPFDVTRPQVNLVSPGDRIRFRIERVEA